MTSMARNILMVGALLGSAALAGTPEGVRFYDAKNYAAALTELQPAAQRGDAQAMLYLAWMFLTWRGCSLMVWAFRKTRHAPSSGH